MKRLPDMWIDKLFARLQGVYGRDFTGQFSTGMVNGVDAGLENAKQTWAEELGGFVDNAEAIAYALSNLPDRCPNSIGFRELCRRAPRKAVDMLEHKLTPEEMARGIEKLQEAQNVVATKKRDFLCWARKPRSALAFAAVLAMAVRDEDDRFIEILEDLRKAGHVVGDELVRLWDIGSTSWVPVK